MQSANSRREYERKARSRRGLALRQRIWVGRGKKGRSPTAYSPDSLWSLAMHRLQVIERVSWEAAAGCLWPQSTIGHPWLSRL